MLGLTLGRVAASEVGENAPNCNLSGFLNDSNIEIESYQGDVLYVDFWASWCPPCAKSFPFLNGLDQEFAPQGLRVLGVNLDEKPEDAREFLRNYPADFDVLADRSGSCAVKFAVRGMPSSYLIDRKGVIRHIHLGFRAADADPLKTMVQSLLAEDPSEQVAANRPALAFNP